MRGLVVVAAALALAGAGAALAAEAPLERAGIADLEARMAAGRLSSETLTRFYVARVGALDRSGPALHAVLALNPDALAEARASDQRRRSGTAAAAAGRPADPDQGQHRDGRPLAHHRRVAGAGEQLRGTGRAPGRAPAGGGGDHPRQDQPQSSGLISAPATPPAAGARSAAWSRNPYALDRSACGSSAGARAAVAAGLAAAAVGSETDGSITCPASMNGVIGFKPTVGLIPRTARRSPSRTARTPPGRSPTPWPMPACWRRSWPGPTREILPPPEARVFLP